MNRRTWGIYGKLAVAVIVTGWCWDMYANRTPACDSLAAHGATRVSDKYCVVPGPLKVESPWPYRRLPSNLVVHGDLSITGTSINALPAGLVVDGAINLYKTDVETLPLETWASGGLTQYTGMYANIDDDELDAWQQRRSTKPPRPAGAP